MMLMFKFVRLFVAVALLLGGFCGLNAKVVPNPIFADNMVLQQNADVALWGEAKAGAKVRISPSWDGKRVVTTADAEGNWFARLATPSAGGPYTIVFDDGKKTEIKNVLIGEVWLCSGQSNMEMPMKGWKGQPVEGSAELIMNAKPEIAVRHCYVKRETSLKVEDKCQAVWTENTPEGVAESSAYAYFFARKLNEVLNVPVGVINVSWGGSSIQAWMSRELLEREFWGKADLRAYETGKWPEGQKGFVPACLYNAMLHPLAPFTVKGFVWYQGCNDRSDYELYKEMQPAFVSMLRREWGNENLPFYFTQIAPYEYDNPDSPLSGYFMWAQAQTLASIPFSGMVATADCGEKHCIHASDKKTPAERMAYLALVNDYAYPEFVDVHTPVAESFVFKDGVAEVTFRTGPLGLKPVSTDIPGFELAGKDGKFHPAVGRIDGKRPNVVIVRSSGVLAPVAVRYCMKNWFEPSLFNCSGIPASPFRSDNDKMTPCDSFVSELMSRMTLEEKIGQLSQYDPWTGPVTGPQGEKYDLDLIIKKGLCGSILNEPKNEVMANRRQKIAVDSSRLGIPILMGLDIIHGARTTFPENIALSCSWDLPLVEKIAEISAKETAACGYNWTFSPMCDLAVDPRWGRVSEGSGEDPYLAGEMSAAMVRGYQGSDLSSPETILACVKHFAGYSAAEAGRDYNTVDMSEMMFRDRFLPVYKAAIDAGALSVMASFNDFDGIPSSGNRHLLTDILRNELGFKGLVVADYKSIIEMVNHGVVPDAKGAACLALNAGLNMAMVDNTYNTYGASLVREGLVSEEQIDRLCREVLTVKYKLGLFEDPYRYGDKDKWENETCLPEYLETAREAARSSMVLLKNENDILPLKGRERIALIGPAADSKEWMVGAWEGMAETQRMVSFKEGLSKRFPNAVIRCERGCADFETIPGGINRAVAAALKSDIVLFAAGLPSWCSGEAASLTSLDLPQAQKELFEALVKTGKPIVLLLSTGRPMTVAHEVEKSKAVLLTWHPGISGGDALADILSGDFNPCGRLTMTFPLELGQVPIHYNEKSTCRPRRSPSDNGKYLSRYMFTPNEPLFAFGEGMSYTSFEYSDVEVLTPVVKMDEDVTVRFRVKNTGQVDGYEVAQVYFHRKLASTTRPVKELKAFKKVFVRAGETVEVTLEIPAERRMFSRADKTWGDEAGQIEVFVGGSSKAAKQSEFEILQ